MFDSLSKVGVFILSYIMGHVRSLAAKGRDPFTLSALTCQWPVYRLINKLSGFTLMSCNLTVYRRSLLLKT